MISVQDARTRICTALAPLAPEQVGLAKADGRVLADDVAARTTAPPADVSAMDGYAVRASDAPPLRLIGTSAAGAPFAGAVGTGQTVRIFTGAVMPLGADAVVIQEDVNLDGQTVHFAAPPAPGKHVRSQGLDFRAGDVVLHRGECLNPVKLALLAAMNVAEVSVIRRPRVAVLSSGSELKAPGSALGPGQIVASNGYALCALITRWGGEPVDFGIVPDELEATRNALLTAAASADLIVTSGGASVGDHDLIKDAVGRLDFWKVAMRPGKPLIFGEVAGTPLLGLAGNPVSAYLGALVFLKPALAVLSGQSWAAPTLTLPLDADVPENGAREAYLRAQRTESGRVRVFARQDSALLSDLAQSDVLLIRLPHAPAAHAGDLVPILPL